MRRNPQNRRLFDLREANYSKLYCERLASKLLIFSVVTMCIWVLLRVLIVRPTGSPSTQEHPDKGVAAISESIQRVERVQQQQSRDLGALTARNASLDEEVRQLHKEIEDLASRRPPAGAPAAKKGRP
jgi:predicted phosphoribosyltransferase